VTDRHANRAAPRPQTFYIFSKKAFRVKRKGEVFQKPGQERQKYEISEK